MASEIELWFRGLPPVTRYLFALSVVFTLAGNFGLISPDRLMFVWYNVLYKFEIWRLVTCFLYHGRLSLNFLFNMLFLIRIGSSLENSKFNGRSSEFFFMLLFGLLFFPMTLIIPMPILAFPLIMIIIYYWSKLNPDAEMSFLFGLKFKAKYLPWVMLGFSVLTGGNPFVELLGIIVGHIYYFVMDRYPQDSGITLIKCPDFLKQWFGEYGVMGHQQGQDPQEPRRMYNWGRGQRLGD